MIKFWLAHDGICLTPVFTGVSMWKDMQQRCNADSLHSYMEEGCVAAAGPARNKWGQDGRSLVAAVIPHPPPVPTSHTCFYLMEPLQGTKHKGALTFL